MTPQRLLFAGVAGLLLGPPHSPAAEPPPSENKSTFWVIPHTHWEGAVFKTRAEYLEMGLPNILKAMKLGLMLFRHFCRCVYVYLTHS
jgi:hypothetical protein